MPNDDLDLVDKIREYIESDLRDGSQSDNLYFGKDKGSIYWVPGAECWCYLCGDKTEWGQVDDLLDEIDDKIILSYYEENKEDIADWARGRGYTL